MTTKREIMEGVEATKSKVVANNTVEYTKPNSTKVIRLHHTDILEFPPRGGVVFNSGGWKTVTTRARMNEFQSECTIIQDKGLWYLAMPLHTWDKDSWTPFFDGIKVKNGKIVKPRRLAYKKEEFLLKQINVYCAKMKKMDELPLPMLGDCFNCSFQTRGGNDLGSTDHLKSHLKEKYIHGSLIWNAMKWAGYPHPEIQFAMQWKDNMVSVVKRYLKAQLGLVH